MIYDIEIFVPVCQKYKQRIEDLKKYGIVNIKNRKVLVSLLVEKNDEIENLETGWHQGVDVNVVRLGGNYITNVFNFFLNIDYENPRSRWVMKIDDDSATDIDGLIYNLDLFYDCNKAFYLAADLKIFDGGGPEPTVFYEYCEFMFIYKDIHRSLQHEMEACVWTIPAIKTMLSDERSRTLLKKRSEIEGGATDVCFAFASALAKQYPINCPFLTYLPKINEFSLITSNNNSGTSAKNHIHLISRKGEGENFAIHNRPSYSFLFLTKIIENKKNSIEEKLFNKRYVAETDHEVTIYKFNENFTLNIKNNNQSWLWFAREENGKKEIVLFDNYSNLHFLEINENGTLKGVVHQREIELYPIGGVDNLKLF